MSYIKRFLIATELTSVKIIQPSMILRWLDRGPDYKPKLQQKWVCMQDGSEEWKDVEVVQE